MLQPLTAQIRSSIGAISGQDDNTQNGLSMLLGSKRNEYIFGLLVAFLLACFAFGSTAYIEKADSIRYNRKMVHRGEPGFEDIVCRAQRTLSIGGCLLLVISGFFAWKTFKIVQKEQNREESAVSHPQ